MTSSKQESTTFHFQQVTYIFFNLESYDSVELLWFDLDFLGV
ncbi:unnamed protein product [Brassica rapa subsp. trilocularis]